MTRVVLSHTLYLALDYRVYHSPPCMFFGIAPRACVLFSCELNDRVGCLCAMRCWVRARSFSPPHLQPMSAAAAPAAKAAAPSASSSSLASSGPARSTDYFSGARLSCLSHELLCCWWGLCSEAACDCVSSVCVRAGKDKPKDVRMSNIIAAKGTRCSCLRRVFLFVVSSLCTSCLVA